MNYLYLSFTFCLTLTFSLQSYSIDLFPIEESAIQLGGEVNIRETSKADYATPAFYIRGFVPVACSDNHGVCLKAGASTYLNENNSGAGLASEVSVFNDRSISVAFVPEVMYLWDKLTPKHPNLFFRLNLLLKLGKSQVKRPVGKGHNLIDKGRVIFLLGHNSHGSGTEGTGEDYFDLIPPITNGQNTKQTTFGGGIEILPWR